MEEFVVTLIVVGAIFYFVPTLVAFGRKNAGAIFFLNLFFGWTILGWIVCFIWACTSPKVEDMAPGDGGPIPAWAGLSGPTEITVRGEDQNNLDGTSRQRIIARLSEGDTVTLVREPNNLADKNAIRVESEHGCIGYVAREEAVRLAPIADAGRIGDVTIKDIVGGDTDRPSRGVWLVANIQSAAEVRAAQQKAIESIPEVGRGTVIATVAVGILVAAAFAYYTGFIR